MSERGQPIYLREDEVIIPRAEYEALMVAVQALEMCRDHMPADLQAREEAMKALAALRATGIPEGEPND